MGTGFYSSIVGIIIVLSISFLYGFFIGTRKERKWRLKIWLTVSVVYLISAWVVSQSFDTVHYFMMTDPCNYISNAANSTSLHYDMEELFINSYLNLADDNGLYNIMISYWGAVCNVIFDGVNSFSLSLLSVVFGILSAITLFRVLSSYFSVDKAFKYTLVFALLSQFHLYSLVILRDICICFFYLLCFEVVQKKFSVKGLILLLVCMILSWGIRLYSGLFVIAFILYYIYKAISHTKIKYIIIPVFVVLVGYFVISSMFVVEQTVEEINTMNEGTIDRGGGMVMRLMSLPPVIKQIAMLFFTQIAPFPPTGPLFEASNISELYMSILVITYEFWWFLIAYTMFYVMLGKGYIMKIDFNDVLLLLISVALIIAASSHPDVRRMMPVYPIIYYEYLKFRSNSFNTKWFKTTRKNLSLIYVVLLMVYLVLKF